MKVTKILAALTAAAAVSASVAATASAYNAYIQWQTTPYSFRNDWNDAVYGAATPYFDSAIVWGSGDDPSSTFPDYADSFDWDIEGYVIPVTYTDVTVDGDGTYTVSMDGFDWALDGASAFNTLGVSTDIPIDAGATITSLSIIVDGAVAATIENPACEGTEFLKINAINIWNTNVPAYSGAYPTDSIAVEFTVTGLGGGADTGADSGVVDTGAADTGAAGSKDSPDTGVEGVAVVAGLAIVAGGAMLLSKKRK